MPHPHKNIKPSHQKPIPAASNKSLAPPAKNNKTASQPIRHTPEIESMLKKIRTMKVDLNTKLQLLYERGKRMGVDVDSIMGNPANFTPAQWAAMQRETEKLSEKIDEVLFPILGPKKKTKTTAALTKERKGKTLGSRKKWMPVR